MRILFRVAVVLLMLIAIVPLTTACPLEDDSDTQAARTAADTDEWQAQDSYDDDKETIEAYYLLEDFLFEIGADDDNQYISHFVEDNPASDDLPDHQSQLGLYVYEGGMQLNFGSEWLAQALGITMREFNFAIRELVNNHRHQIIYTIYRNGDYDDDLETGHEEYSRQIYFEGVFLTHIVVIDTTQSDPDNRVLKDAWLLSKPRNNPHIPSSHQ